MRSGIRRTTTMEAKFDAQKNLDKLIESLNGKKPSLLLHCCCGPCASYCIDYLVPYFDITAYFFNPNIMPQEEYKLRLETFDKLLSYYPSVKRIVVKGGEDKFLSLAKGLEALPENSERCRDCIRMRLYQTAADSAGYDYFATTLTVSPHKDADFINAAGKEIEYEFKRENRACAAFLPTDFKKKDGFKKSVELSRKYGLYRQIYCGCIFNQFV